MNRRVLIVVEPRPEGVARSAFELASAGRRLAESCGAELEAVVMAAVLPREELAGLRSFGVSRVHTVEREELAHYNVHIQAPMLVGLVRDMQPLVVLGAASAQGKDLLPRIAAGLRVPMVSDCVALDWQQGRLSATRPVYGGKAMLRLRFCAAPPFVASLRPNAFTRQPQQCARIDLVPAEVCAPASPLGLCLGTRESETPKGDLNGAEIIVSGGRGLGTKENFALLQELANLLGGAVGATRAAVDAQWASYDMQVGQTGRTVSPGCYLAFGLSGAVQHLAGMRSSKKIIAVNKEKDAPIFEIADFGVVGDLFQVVPELIRMMRERLV